MKKFKTKEEIRKTKNRNRMIVGIIFIALMVFSSAGFALYGQSGGSGGSDSGYDQENPFFNGQYWQYDFSGQQFFFSQKVEDSPEMSVELDGDIQEYVNGRTFVDTENSAAFDLLSLNLARYSQRFQEGCYGPCEENLPELDCEGPDNLIIFTDAEENRVYQEGKCVFIEGGLESIDAFFYKLLGII